MEHNVSNDAVKKPASKKPNTAIKRGLAYAKEVTARYVPKRQTQFMSPEELEHNKNLLQELIEFNKGKQGTPRTNSNSVSSLDEQSDQKISTRERSSPVTKAVRSASPAQRAQRDVSNLHVKFKPKPIEFNKGKKGTLRKNSNSETSLDDQSDQNIPTEEFVERSSPVTKAVRSVSPAQQAQRDVSNLHVKFKPKPIEFNKGKKGTPRKNSNSETSLDDQSDQNIPTEEFVERSSPVTKAVRSASPAQRAQRDVSNLHVKFKPKPIEFNKGKKGTPRKNSNSETSLDEQSDQEIPTGEFVERSPVTKAVKSVSPAQQAQRDASNLYAKFKPKPKAPIVTSKKDGKCKNLVDSSKFNKKSEYYKYLAEKSEHVCSRETVTGDDKKIQEKKELLQALIDANNNFREFEKSRSRYPTNRRPTVAPSNVSEAPVVDCPTPLEDNDNSTPVIESQKPSISNKKVAFQEPSKVIGNKNVSKTPKQPPKRNLAGERDDRTSAPDVESPKPLILSPEDHEDREDQGSSKPLKVAQNKNVSKAPKQQPNRNLVPESDDSSIPEVDKRKPSSMSREELLEAAAKVIQKKIVPKSRYKQQKPNPKLVRDPSKMSKMSQDIPVIFYCKHPPNNNSPAQNPNVVKKASNQNICTWRIREELLAESIKVFQNDVRGLTNDLEEVVTHMKLSNTEGYPITESSTKPFKHLFDIPKRPENSYYLKRYLKPAKFSTYLPLFNTYKDALTYFKQTIPLKLHKRAKNLNFWDVLELIRWNCNLNKDPDKIDADEEMSFYMQNYVFAFYSNSFQGEKLKLRNIETIIKFVNEAHEPPQPVLRQPSLDCLLYRRTLKQFVQNAPTAFCRKFDMEKKFRTRLRIDTTIEEVDDSNLSVSSDEEASLSVSDLEDVIDSTEIKEETSENLTADDWELDSHSSTSEHMCADFTGADDEKLVGWTEDFTQEDYCFNFYEIHHPLHSSSEESLDLPKLPISARDLEKKEIVCEPEEDIYHAPLRDIWPCNLPELKNEYITNLESELLTRLECLTSENPDSEVDSKQNENDPPLLDGLSFSDEELDNIKALTDLLSQILDNPEAVDLTSVPRIMQNIEDTKFDVVQEYKEQVLRFFVEAKKKEAQSMQIKNSEMSELPNSLEESAPDKPRLKSILKSRSFNAEEENDLIEFAELLAQMRSNLELVDLNSVPRIINNIEGIQSNSVQVNKEEALLLFEEAKIIQAEAIRMKQMKKAASQKLQNSDPKQTVKKASAPTAEDREHMMEFASLVSAIRTNPNSVDLNTIPRIVQNIENVNSHMIQIDKEEVILFYETETERAKSEQNENGGSTKRSEGSVKSKASSKSVSPKLSTEPPSAQDGFTAEDKKHMMEFALLLSAIRTEPNTVDLNIIPRIVQNIENVKSYMIQIDKKEVILFYEKETERAKSEQSENGGSTKRSEGSVKSKASSKSNSKKILPKVSAKPPSAQADFTAEEKQHIVEFALLLSAIRTKPNTVDLNIIPRIVQNIENIKNYSIQVDKKEVILFYEKETERAKSEQNENGGSTKRSEGSVKSKASLKSDSKNILPQVSTEPPSAQGSFTAEDKKHMMEFALLVSAIRTKPETVDINIIPRIVQNIENVNSYMIQEDKKEVILFFENAQKTKGKSKKLSSSRSSRVSLNSNRSRGSSKLKRPKSTKEKNLQKVSSEPPRTKGFTPEEKKYLSEFASLVTAVRENPHSIDLNIIPRIVHNIDDIKNDAVQTDKKMVLHFLEKTKNMRANQLRNNSERSEESDADGIVDEAPSMMGFENLNEEEKTNLRDFLGVLIKLREDPESVDLSCVPRAINSVIDIKNDFVEAHIKEMVDHVGAIRAKSIQLRKSAQLESTHKQVESSSRVRVYEPEPTENVQARSSPSESGNFQSGMMEFDNLSHEEKGNFSKFMGLLAELRQNPEMVDLNCASRVIKSVMNIQSGIVRDHLKEAVDRLTAIKAKSSPKMSKKESEKEVYEQSECSPSYKFGMDNDRSSNFSFELEEDPELYNFSEDVSNCSDTEGEFDQAAYMANWEKGFKIPKCKQKEHEIDYVDEEEDTNSNNKKTTSKPNVRELKSPYLTEAPRSTPKKLNNSSLGPKVKNSSNQKQSISEVIFGGNKSKSQVEFAYKSKSQVDCRSEVAYGKKPSKPTIPEFKSPYLTDNYALKNKRQLPTKSSKSSSNQGGRVPAKYPTENKSMSALINSGNKSISRIDCGLKSKSQTVCEKQAFKTTPELKSPYLSDNYLFKNKTQLPLRNSPNKNRPLSEKSYSGNKSHPNCELKSKSAVSYGRNPTKPNMPQIKSPYMPDKFVLKNKKQVPFKKIDSDICTNRDDYLNKSQVGCGNRSKSQSNCGVKRKFPIDLRNKPKAQSKSQSSLKALEERKLPRSILKSSTKEQHLSTPNLTKVVKSCPICGGTEIEGPNQTKIIVHRPKCKYYQKTIGELMEERYTKPGKTERCNRYSLKDDLRSFSKQSTMSGVKNRPKPIKHQKGNKSEIEDISDLQSVMASLENMFH